MKDFDAAYCFITIPFTLCFKVKTQLNLALSWDKWMRLYSASDLCILNGKNDGLSLNDTAPLYQAQRQENKPYLVISASNNQ